MTCKRFYQKYYFIIFDSRNPRRRTQCSGFNKNQCNMTSPRYDRGQRCVREFQIYLNGIIYYIFIKLYLCNFQENICNNFFMTSAGFHFRCEDDCWIDPSTHATICILYIALSLYLPLIANYTIGRERTLGALCV